MNNIKESGVASEDSSSDNDTDSWEDEQDCSSANGSRSKRSLQWCAVDTDTYHHKKLNHNHPHHNHVHRNHPHRQSSHHPPKKVVWPPPSNSTPSTSSSSQWRFGNVREGNPKLGSKMQLFSQTGHFLAVYPDGTVRGNSDENDLHTYLEIISAGQPGHIRIKSLLTNLYIAMDRRGHLYGESRTELSAAVDPMMEPTVFIESFQGLYNAYLSRKYAHLGWYIGIKRNGKIKRGPTTAYGQKAVKFLPRRQKFE